MFSISEKSMELKHFFFLTSQPFLFHFPEIVSFGQTHTTFSLPVSILNDFQGQLHIDFEDILRSVMPKSGHQSLLFECDHGTDTQKVTSSIIVLISSSSNYFARIFVIVLIALVMINTVVNFLLQSFISLSTITKSGLMSQIGGGLLKLKCLMYFFVTNSLKKISDLRIYSWFAQFLVNNFSHPFMHTFSLFLTRIVALACYMTDWRISISAQFEFTILLAFNRTSSHEIILGRRIQFLSSNFPFTTAQIIILWKCIKKDLLSYYIKNRDDLCGSRQKLK